MHPRIVCHVSALTHARPYSLHAAEAFQNDFERRASNSGGDGDAGPGQRTIASAFAVSKFHEGPIEGTKK
jgi:hypothetical protein